MISEPITIENLKAMGFVPWGREIKRGNFFTVETNPFTFAFEGKQSRMIVSFCNNEVDLHLQATGMVVGANGQKQEQWPIRLYATDMSQIKTLCQMIKKQQ